MAEWPDPDRSFWDRGAAAAVVVGLFAAGCALAAASNPARHDWGPISLVCDAPLPGCLLGWGYLGLNALLLGMSAFVSVRLAIGAGVFAAVMWYFFARGLFVMIMLAA